MSWVRLDDQLPDHPKMLDLSCEAFRLWTYCLCRANARQSGGLLARKLVEVTAGYFTSIERAAGLAAELVTAGLWHEVEGGWEIHDYEDYRPKTSAEDARKAKAAERMRLARARDKAVREQCANSASTRARTLHDEDDAHVRERAANGSAHENGTHAHAPETAARASNNARACAPPGPSHPGPINTDTPQPPKGEQVGLALDGSNSEPEQLRNRGASKASATRLATELLAELNAARKRVNPKNRELAPVEVHLKHIRERLLEGITADDIRHVIKVQEARSRNNPVAAGYFDSRSPFLKNNIGMWLAKTVEDSGRPEPQAGPLWGQPDPVAPPYFDRYVPKPRRESEPPPPGTLDVLKNLRPAP